MVLESALTVAAVVGLVVALLQLLVWAYQLIAACDGYLRKRNSRDPRRHDVELAFLEPSGQSARSADTTSVQPIQVTDGHGSSSADRETGQVFETTPLSSE